MIRTVRAMGAVALGVAAVAARTDPIAACKALMKANGDQAKMGSAMAKGEAAFDLAKARAIFVAFAAAAANPTSSTSGPVRFRHRPVRILPPQPHSAVSAV